MERSDLGNYRRLYRAGHVNAPQLGVLVAYSLLKVPTPFGDLRRLLAMEKIDRPPQALVSISVVSHPTNGFGLRINARYPGKLCKLEP